MFITRIATYSSWTSKPTPRSDTARLRSNAFKILGNDDVFLIACIVMIFNTMVVKQKKALKTQLTTSVKCTPLTLAIFAKVRDQCSVSSITMQRNFIALEESSVFE